MKTQYAHMVGSICLDKAILPEYELEMNNGKGQPITFEIWKVYNGSFFPGHNSRDKALRYNFETVAQAQKELHQLFQMEMSERGYEFREWGKTMIDFETEGGEYHKAKFFGESGWYDTRSPRNIFGPYNLQYECIEHTPYPLEYFPRNSADWTKKQITGFAYDNYKIVITTSNRDIVSL